MLRSVARVFPTAQRAYLATNAVPSASAPSPKPSRPPKAVKYPYFVPRNSNGNLPVYSDIRNNGTRLQVLIRNIDGKANALADDLAKSLFPSNSPKTSQMRIEIVRSKNIVITGGRWKNDVVEWLKQKGF